MRDGWAKGSALAKANFAWHDDLRCGPEVRQTLDLFPAHVAGAPLLIFIHGGYWQANDKTNYGFIADPVVSAGGALANINYGLAPEYAMAEIIEHARAAILWLYDNASDGIFDNQKVYVAGHSADGHLAAKLLATDWPALGVPANLVRGITAISGVFDLAPLIETSINDKPGRDQKSARPCSPLFHSPTNSAPVTVAVGGDETEEFLRQAKSYTACCQTAGCAADLLRLNGFNHDAIVNQMSDANATLIRAVLHQMDWA